MPKVFITGASGMLGSAVVETFAKKGWHVSAQFRSRSILTANEHTTTIQADLTDPSSIERLSQAGPFDLIVHCAAGTNLESCENEFASAIAQNCLATHHVVEIAKKSQNPSLKLIYISSDAVYPDIVEAKQESLAPNPATAYGLTKYWGEMLVHQRWPNSLVLRTTIVGSAPAQFCAWIVSQAIRQRPITLFSDVTFTPISVGHLSEVIFKSFQSNLQGTFNVGSTDRITKADFGRELLGSLELNGVIQPCSLNSLNSRVKRSFNMTLDSTKMYRALGSEGFSVKDSIIDIARQMRPTLSR